MCRIFGISYGDTPEEMTASEIAATLYPALVHQGPHAWGWMAYDGNAEGTIRFFKMPGRCDTVKARERQLAEIPEKARWVVGHLRYATHGKPHINANNHPIPHGHIIGIHNGVLRNHADILKVTGREDDKSIVDSEAIFAAINKWGPMKGLRKIKGDMVTVWADDRKPDRIHLARSHGRQVTIGWTTNGNIIFASEQQALMRLMPHIQFVKFSTVSENKLMTIVDGKIEGRREYAPPTHHYIPPAPRIRPMTTFAEWERERYSDRASRRGEILFPKSKSEAAKKGKSKGRRIVTEDINEIVDITTGPLPEPQDGKLYYLDGELMTAAEYRALSEDF